MTPIIKAYWVLACDRLKKPDRKNGSHYTTPHQCPLCLRRRGDEINSKHIFAIAAIPDDLTQWSTRQLGGLEPMTRQLGQALDRRISHLRRRPYLRLSPTHHLQRLRHRPHQRRIVEHIRHQHQINPNFTNQLSESTRQLVRSPDKLVRLDSAAHPVGLHIRPEPREQGSHVGENNSIGPESTRG
ncbi:hypothetical protein Cgig2_026831 [Carnegiea gigantea]|uniref:Uncharacterized protein n=1 Tax=Carnegiea gigantea TaxID=171969 RepID=A0A9Q1KYV1_9CARY|nr:hypothetical protein Cgig2_026831 [Carnegiea gigantea]